MLPLLQVIFTGLQLAFFSALGGILVTQVLAHVCGVPVTKNGQILALWAKRHQWFENHTRSLWLGASVLTGFTLFLLAH